MTYFSRLAGGSAPVVSTDPLWMIASPYWDLSQQRNAAGREPRSPTSSLRTLTIVGAGQSNISNSGDFEYVPVNGTVENLSIVDGGVYAARDPLLGCSSGISSTGMGFVGGNWLGQLGDKLIGAGWCDRVVLVPIGVDASSIQNWAPDRTPPIANLTHRFDVARRRLGMAGLTADAIVWMQGETDALLPGVTQAFYQQWLGDLIAASRTFGFTCPWFVCVTTHTGFPGNPMTNQAAIRAAQAAIVDHGLGIWAGPDTDAFTGASYRQTADDTHLNSNGADQVAAAMVDKLGLYGAPFNSDETIEVAASADYWAWDSGAPVIWS